jgi:hypothetical protein
VSDHHRGEVVDLAVKGQLAPTLDDHHQHLDLVVAVGLDAITLAEPYQVGLQILPVEPPQRPGMVSGRRQAGQVDRRDRVSHATIFPSPTIVPGLQQPVVVQPVDPCGRWSGANSRR